ncbi:MAG: hypothetical protein JSU83_05275 [Deltaproteobacteria bacterium]|nr:MAG: hypothetical protein JSU83_05275 [Deltaproteobacteria bacterium]
MHRPVFLYIGLIPVILLCNVLLSTLARGEGVSFRTDQRYSNSDSSTEITTTGEEIDTSFSSFKQLYDLDLSKTIYPYLNFDAGAVYELNRTASTAENIELDTKEKILRPFAELNLDSPVYNAGIAYRKRQREESITDLPDTRDDRDEITALLGMRAQEWLPQWDMRFSHIHTYDNPETVDNIEKLLSLYTNYTAWNALRLDYRFSYRENEDRLDDFTTKQHNHFGTVGYSHNFLDGRLLMDTEYRIRYNTFEFPGSATVESPLQRSAGLSSLDITPEDGPALSSNVALIDGNLIASAGLDIGTAGDQVQLANIGLDLGFAVDVDQVHIWVDRRLTATVANSFSWSVYTSPDNLDTSTWTLVTTVSPANFGAFDNRFEITFPAVNTRFIKVVTSALFPTVPGAVDFPNIFVTEMQAFITLQGVEVDNKQTTINHNYNLNLIGRLSDKTTLGYNLFYRLQEEDPSSDKRTELTNGIYMNHIFDDVFSANANGQRTETSDLDEDNVTYRYGASLNANWLKTFDQSLTYSGIYEELVEGTAFQNSIFLRNNATLYRGWSAFVDTGYNWEETVTRQNITSTTIKVGTDLVPNEKINFNVNYSNKRTDQSGLDTGSSTETEWDIQAFYNPFTNLSLLARLNFIDRPKGTQTFQDFSVNWSPFPDGDLQFFFVYTDTLRFLDPDDQRDTIIGPGLKWTIGRHIFLDMTYNFTRNERETQKTESNIINAELRLVF